jgi:hypothetical protein
MTEEAYPSSGPPRLVGQRHGGRVHPVRRDHAAHGRGVPGPAGLVAIFENEFYVQTRNYLFQFDATTWGWIHLVLGLLVAFAGWGLLSGQTWARVVGITLAALSATANFLFLPYYPFWSLLIIAVDIFVIWALTAHGREYRELKDAEAEYRMHR